MDDVPESRYVAARGNRFLGLLDRDRLLVGFFAAPRSFCQVLGLIDLVKTQESP